MTAKQVFARAVTLAGRSVTGALTRKEPSTIISVPPRQYSLTGRLGVLVLLHLQEKVPSKRHYQNQFHLANSLTIAQKEGGHFERFRVVDRMVTAVAQRPYAV
jgi:hypothetical protein